MNSKGHYIFYGTLRVGMENHSLFQNGMQYLQTVELTGFKLYSLGEYPYAVKSNNDPSILVGELFKIHDSETAQAIHNMEIDAGYYYEEIVVHGVSYGIYLFEKASPQDREIIGGDWVRFVH